MKIAICYGDCLEWLKNAADASVDAVICDPPYALSFMGREWDSFGRQKSYVQRVANPVSMMPRDFPMGNGRGGANHDVVRFRLRAAVNFQEFSVTWMREVSRVLRSGGVVKAFGGTRTFHRLAAAMEYVGLRNISLSAWCYATGFPKSMDISKALDKPNKDDLEAHEVQLFVREHRKKKGLPKAYVDAIVFGGTTRYSWVEGRGGSRANEMYMPAPDEWDALKRLLGMDDRFDAYILRTFTERHLRRLIDGGNSDLITTVKGDFGYQDDASRWAKTRRILSARSELAKQWAGWGTALKPAWEPIIVGRKP